MRVTQQPAYLLHTRPWRETSLLLEAFTRDHGRVGLLARGVRRASSRLSRGLLQPLQPLLLDWSGRGELATLSGVDVSGPRLGLDAERLLSALYVNELVLRLSARNDPLPAAFEAYALCLSRLATAERSSWTLRRFERDLLIDLGYGLTLKRDIRGVPIAAERAYAWDPAFGVSAWREGSAQLQVEGAALLALDQDLCPPPTQLGQLRHVLRSAIRQLLGADLRAWSFGSSLRRLGVPPQR